MSKTFQVPNEVISNDSTSQLTFDIEVINGVVQDVRVQMSPDLLDPELIDLSEILLKLDFNDRLVQKNKQEWRWLYMDQSLLQQEPV